MQPDYARAQFCEMSESQYDSVLSDFCRTDLIEDDFFSASQSTADTLKTSNVTKSLY